VCECMCGICVCVSVVYVDLRSFLSVMFVLCVVCVGVDMRLSFQVKTEVEEPWTVPLR